MMLGPEQKSVERTMDLMSRFCKVRELVLEACAGTLATARASLQLSEHRRSVRYEDTSHVFMIRRRH